MAVSKRLRYEVLRRDDHACRYCGGRAPDVKLTVDHVVPTTLGGSDDPSNLVAACSDCNSGKSASSPDAPLVDQVAEDALRWAKAMEQAAAKMLVDLSRREELRGQFQAKWNTWTVKGEPIPLPTGWQISVDNFLAAGLPMAVLLDCVDIGMRNQKVDAQNTFRYVCGVAWKRVNDLQAAAHAGLLDHRAAPGQTTPGRSEADQYVDKTLRGILSLRDDIPITESLHLRSKEVAEEAWDDHGIQLNEDQALLIAAAQELSAELPCVAEGLETLIRSFPKEQQDLAQIRAVDRWQRWEMSPSTGEVWEGIAQELAEINRATTRTAGN